MDLLPLLLINGNIGVFWELEMLERQVSLIRGRSHIGGVVGRWSSAIFILLIFITRGGDPVPADKCIMWPVNAKEKSVFENAPFPNHLKTCYVCHQATWASILLAFGWILSLRNSGMVTCHRSPRQHSGDSKFVICPFRVNYPFKVQVCMGIWSF